MTVFQTVLENYNPKIRLYPKKERNGNIKYYLAYFLPNGKQIKRPCHHKEKEAKRLMSYKERELLRGEFDELDQKKLGVEKTVTVVTQTETKRFTLLEGIDLFLEKTAGRRKPITQYKDQLCLQMMGKRLAQEKTYLDEIRPLDVQNLFDNFNKEGKAEATMKTYARTLSKVFHWFIEDMELLEMRNPVKKVTIAKKNGEVRDHMPTPQEVKALLSTELDRKSKSTSPICEIVQFLLFTGCREGECLHLEWDDVDLANGVLHIRKKPKCPTVFGQGWSPKWEKERTIDLFPEAIALLERLPKQAKVFGKIPIRDEDGKLVDHHWVPANFVFPKKEVFFVKHKRHVRYTRVDNISHTWATFSKKAQVHGVQIKDFRNYFNYLLTNHYGFTHKEAGTYLGNSEIINHKHYTPVLRSDMRRKMQKMSLLSALNE